MPCTLHFLQCRYTLTNSNFCHFLEDGGSEDNPEYAHVYEDPGISVKNLKCH